VLISKKRRRDIRGEKLGGTEVPNGGWGANLPKKRKAKF